jgi:aminoglycoside/choline kinase family phosphotransferase
MIGAVIGETVFYRFAPQLPIRTIRSYYSGIDQDDQGLVLLEDLADAGTTFLAAVTPLTVAQTRDGLDQLARLHGAYWDLPRPENEQDWPVFANNGPLGRAMRGWVIPTLPEIMSQPHLQGRIPETLMNGRFGQGMSRLLDMTSEGPHCLIHFDPHLGNLSLNRDGEIVLMDWQFFRAGHWSHDVSYFISSVLTTEDRRQAERDLLAYYLERLRAHGGQPPSFEEAWHFYVAGQLYGVFSWVCTQLQMQTLETIYTLLNRHLTAVADLETLDLLGV